MNIRKTKSLKLLRAKRTSGSVLGGFKLIWRIDMENQLCKKLKQNKIPWALKSDLLSDKF